ncbi:MAG TPA: hypothetical protein P5244_02385 [Syntrophales bacterium]|nr:hypothetical protein [Syntrophales bacterium]HRT69952.1 hypothetical protein [Syntrophales bacterium]
MTTGLSPAHSKNSKHRWTFFRAGGFDQVRLDDGADLMSLDRLDQKLWVALSCPTGGVELDGKTLELIDSDGDGRIRVPEIIEAVKWTVSLLKNPDELIKRSPNLPLSSINDESVEGSQILSSARYILASLGKEDATEIAVDDMADVQEIMTRARFNGDGIIPADAADDAALQGIISDIIDCVGPEDDRSGKPGISKSKLDQFFTDALAYSEWWREAESNADVIFPLSDDPISAAAAFMAVQEKVDDFFTRCRLAAFDTGALKVLDCREGDHPACTAKNLSQTLEEISGLPLARIEPRKALPLKEGVNPAWIPAISAFYAQVVKPLLGDKATLTEEEWEHIKEKFNPYKDWLSRKAGTAVEKLGLDRVREILNGNAKELIGGLIAADKALEAEFDHITSVEKLARYYRDLFTLLNNFVSFGDFYTRKRKAIFQAGSLYMDGRSCELCVRVEDVDKHSTLASLSRMFLAYCDCRRRNGTEKMTVAAAFTGGDSDYLMAGRNGVFYDRKGQDWDATIVKIIDNPISIRQAFWSPYKQFARMIGRQVSKLAAARDRAIIERAAAGTAVDAQAIAAGKAAPPPFDVAKFAGIFAAIGLAAGFIGSAIVSIFTGFFKLAWWQMPLVIAGAILVISTPSVIIAWLKLRQRTLGPLLDANGWAVNARARINVTFGNSLTKIAALPDGAVRSLEDPFADKKKKWPTITAILVILLFLLYWLNKHGVISRWMSGLFG